MSKPTSTETYIATFPPEIQERLQSLRATIKQTAPEAAEVISYSMPAYKLGGMLVYFAGYERHVGFYPGASTMAHFQNDIKGFKNAKGSIQFPHGQPLPLELVKKMVEFKVAENRAKIAAKKKG